MYILLIISAIISFCLPNITHAETRITNGYFPNGATWTKAGSPYILEDDINIFPDRPLYIGPGTIVRSGTQMNSNNEPFSIRSYGGITINGTKDEPVIIDSLGWISLWKYSSIKNAKINNTTINTYEGTTTIISSLLSGSSVAVTARKSHIDIRDSEIVGNNIGVLSEQWSPGPFLMYKENDAKEYGIGGLGNALDSYDLNQNVINIHNSILENNTEYDVKNDTSNVVDARDNWWGSSAGPGTSVNGAVLVDPWKMQKFSIEESTCCSNVLFLPGFEGSRLSRDENFLVSFARRLWEPDTSVDVKKLYMNEQGSSIDPAIYTSGIIDSGLGIKDIYKKFANTMKAMVADKTINEWLPFAYDWRMNVSDIAIGDIRYATTTKKLVMEIERLVSTSQTHKVTIVAHSNGGLVAKMLGHELEKLGKSDLIDKVVFVAVPQLGTPHAIAALLHGDEQSIGYGLILGASTARTFGLNLPGAYGLLPSYDYFNRVIDPIITFADKAVGSYDDFKAFLTGTASTTRIQPREDDLKSPAVLTSTLIDTSKTIHDIIDNWQFPKQTEVLSIVGWGLPTTKTIEYASMSKPYSPVFAKTLSGDHTVVSYSAEAYDGSTVYFNQGLLKHEKNTEIRHESILESDSLNKLISKVVATSTLTAGVGTTLPQYITTEKPQVSDYPWMSYITVSVHSPVDIDIYDTRGGHIGIIPLPTNPDSDLRWLEDTIGATYDAVGDEKYITLPADDTYNIKLKGTDYGEFTFKVQKFIPGTSGNLMEAASTTYTDLPVTPFLTASTSVNALTLSPPLGLDVDGNGVMDIKALPSKVMDPLIYLDSIAITVKSLNMSASVEKQLLKRIEVIRDSILKDKKGKVISKQIKTLMKPLHEEGMIGEHKNMKKISSEDRQTLYNMLDTLLKALEASALTP